MTTPLFDELEDWDRDLHWHFFIPTPAYYDFTDANGRDPQTSAEAGPLFIHLRVPKIWEVGAIASIAERQVEGLLNGLRDKSGKPVLEAQKKTGRVVLDLLNLNIMPQAFAPAVESAANRKFFFDRPIETAAEKSMEPWARSGAYTSRTVRAAGEATRHLPRELQLSPKQLEALIRGYLNTWGMYGLTLADAAFFDDVPQLRPDQYPLVRRFYRQHPARNTRHVTELYDAIEAATAARRTMRFMDKTHRPELADEMEHRRENSMYSQMQFANNQMRAFRAETGRILTARSLEQVQAIANEYSTEPDKKRFVRRLKRSDDWNDLPALKRSLLEFWVAERNAFAESVVKDVKAQSRDLRLESR